MAIKSLELITQRICMKKDIGVHDNLFGGYLMCWMDEAGAAFVTQQIDDPRVVTLKVSELLFKEPIKISQLIKIYGEVKKVGDTSITIGLEARRHESRSGYQKLVCSVEMVFVRIDECGEPYPISQKIKDKFNK